MWQDYEVLEEIGSGASGVVHRARHRELGRVVALKVLCCPEGDDAGRFRREATLAASLDHPHIASVYEFGEHDGRLFYAMKLIEGADLSRSGAALRADWKQLAATLAIVARALHHAHEKGVLHRDLKPANIVLDRDGQPHLVDFGLARSVQSDRTLTETGVIVGTPAYLSPEQAAGRKDLTPAADIWSLGVVLYELLAGRLPFQGPTPYATLLAIQTQKLVFPGAISRSVPRDLQTISLRCLEKSPVKRYATAAALADDLERFSRGERIPPRPRKWKQALAWSATRIYRAIRRVKQNPLGSAAAAAIVMLLAAVVWLRLDLIEADIQATQARADTEKAERNAKQREADAAKAGAQAQEALHQTEASEQRESEARSKQYRAELLTYVRQLRQAQLEIERGKLAEAQTILVQIPSHLRSWEHNYLMRLAQKYPGVDCKHPGVTCVALSPDGKRIVFGGDGVKLWDAETGQEIPLMGHAESVRSVAFSPDDKRILTVGFGAPGKPGELKVLDAQTGKEEFSLPGISGQHVFSAAFSPDGKRIVAGAGPRGEVRVWDAITGRELLSLKGHSDGANSVAFSPDGKRIVACNDGGMVKLWNADTGAEVLTMGHPGKVTSVAFSPDGKRIVSGGEDMTVRVWDAETGRRQLILEGHKSGILSVAFSPDGKRIVSNDKGPDNTIRLWDAVSGWEVLTLKRPKESRNIALSPDGKRIVGCEDGLVKVWDGSPGPGGLNLREAHRRLNDGPRREFETGSLVVSRDGKGIASQHVGTMRLWDGEWGIEVATFEQGLGSPTFSPDGRRLACAGKELIVWDLDSREVQLSLKGPTSGLSRDGLPNRVQWLAFSPDGKRIVATGTDDWKEEGAVRVWDADTGQEQFTVRRRSRRVVTYVVFSPDSQRMVWCDTQNLTVLDAHTGQELRTLKGVPENVSSVAFSPDGKRIIAGGYQVKQPPPPEGAEDAEGVVKVWDAQTGQELLTLEGIPKNVNSVAFSPDGKRIIAGGYSYQRKELAPPPVGVVKVWDAQTGQPQLTLRANMGVVEFMAITPDGARIVTASGVSPDSGYDGKDKGPPPPGDVKVWDAQTGKELRSLKRSTRGAASVTLSPDGKTLTCTGWDGVQVLDVQTGP